MNITCSACGKTHKTSSKIERSVEQLHPGQKIRLKCSKCGEAIAIGREDLYGRDAGPSGIQPPAPPDTGWLKQGLFDDEEVVSDIPQALVMMRQGEARDQVASALAGLGYRVDTADDIKESIKKLQFFNYTCVVLHEGSGEFANNRLHRYLCRMEMARRRYILYVLVGPNLKTCYDMQALAHSANLVVNDVDITHFGVILRKAIPEYETLFGPYMDELKIQGK
jgi:hypothetical protein